MHFNNFASCPESQKSLDIAHSVSCHLLAMPFSSLIRFTLLGGPTPTSLSAQLLQRPMGTGGWRIPTFVLTQTLMMASHFGQYRYRAVIDLDPSRAYNSLRLCLAIDDFDRSMSLMKVKDIAFLARNFCSRCRKSSGQIIVVVLHV